MKETRGMGDAWITKEPSRPIFIKIHNSILRIDTMNLVYIQRHPPSGSCTVQAVYDNNTYQIYEECTEEQAGYVVQEIMEAMIDIQKTGPEGMKW